ncbi:MAG: hypothetical protein KJT03_22510, partial [Verrucomicrobiae bacterium]|nr:hypothetical protein [Verrucomicrobiae bacterium]
QIQANSDNPEKNNRIEAYFFISGDLLAFVKGKPFVTSQVSNSQIFISRNGSNEALDANTTIGFRPKPAVANTFLNVDAFEYSLVNHQTARKEVRLLSELSYSQSMSDGEIGAIRSINPEIPDEDLISQEQEYRERMERQIDDLRMLENQWVDTLSLKFTLTPNQSMSNVYVVCGLSFDQAKDEEEKIEKGSRMAVHFLGDLEGEKSKNFRFNKRLERFDPINTNCELFFFQGNAEPVAHTSARKLRPLNAEEAEQVRALLSQALSN